MLLLGAASSAAVACGGAAPSRPDPSPTTQFAGAAHKPDLSSITLSTEDRQGLSVASPQQAAAAADGAMSFAEYEAIVLEGIECFRAEGYESRYGLKLTAYGYYYLEFVPVELGQGGEKESCRALLNPAQAIWNKAKLPTVPQSAHNAAHDLLWRCVRESGVDLKGKPEGVEAASAILDTRGPALDALRGCQERVFDELGIPNWIG